MLRASRLPWPRPRARRVLVLGGARSGKSTHAERLLTRRAAVTYVATAPARPDDAEWRRRVAAHRGRRPAGWRTLETTALGHVLREESGPLLVDCLTLWLSTVMDECGVWDEDAAGHRAADGALAARVDDLLDGWRARRGEAVVVSNELGSGVVPATASGRRFRDELGWLNQRVAADADQVWLVVAGISQRLA